MKEFLNFLVFLTKELHIAHVLILSSNTIFIDKIYNDAKLKVTSRFYKVDHLSYEDTKAWLDEEKFSEDEISIVWDYLGGCIPYLYDLITEKADIKDLKDHLDKKAFLAYTEIVDLLIRQDKKVKEMFREIAKKIVQNGSFVLEDKEDADVLNAISYFAEKEILFYDLLSLKANGNNRTYEKGMEILLRK